MIFKMIKWKIEHGLCACTVDSPLAKARGLSLRTGAQPMLYLTCTTITSVDLKHYVVSRAKDWVSVDCGTKIWWRDSQKKFHQFGVRGSVIRKIREPNSLTHNYILFLL